MMIHRTVGHPAWWLFGAGLGFAAWWGLPLIESTALQNHFFGLFWYSMLGLGAAIWAVPAEQHVTANQVERRYCLLGLVPLWKHAHPISNFSALVLEQDPNIFGRDSVWVMFVGQGDFRLVFARFRATERGVARASAMVAELSKLTGLPINAPT